VFIYLKMHFMKNVLFAVVCLFSFTAAVGQTMVYFKDINPGTAPGDPDHFLIFNNNLVLNAQEPTYGRELYKYDGQAVSLIYDIYPGSASGLYSHIAENMTVANGELFFDADNGTDGHELYGWDGINPPALVYDIIPGVNGSYPLGLITLNGKVYFTANNSVSGRELMVHDPVVNATALAADIIPGAAGSNPDCYAVFNNKLYFNAATSAMGRELYVYDPANNSFALVADIWAGATGSFPSNLVVHGNKLYFTATTSAFGKELYSYDGTSILRLTDINTGPGSSFTSSGYAKTIATALFKGLIYFSATNGTTGYQLYKFDPSNGVSTLVLKINATGNASPSYFTEYAGKLYFAADDGITGNELWVYDGSNNPSLVADIEPGPGSSDPLALTLYNDRIVFNGGTSQHGRELFYLIDTTLGIKNLRFTGNVKIYPNPVLDECYLQITLKQAQTMYVSLTDATGKTVYKSILTEFTPGDHKLTIPMKELPAGNYFYHLVNAAGSTLATGKVIKE
jgi:ELWxxDGT repeat protein